MNDLRAAMMPPQVVVEISSCIRGCGPNSFSLKYGPVIVQL
jgi:hypothetical protein